MKQYPFQERVRTALDVRNKKLNWLLTHFEKSERWFYNIKDFTKLEIWEVDRFSQVLETNFVADYNFWLQENNQQVLHIFAEPAAEYHRPEKRVHVQLKLSAREKDAEENLSKMFALIRKEGGKLGFEIE